MHPHRPRDGPGGQGGDDAGKQPAQGQDAHAGNFQGEQSGGDLAAKDGGEARAHAAHDGQVLVALPHPGPLADQLGQGTAQLQGRALPSGGAAEDVGQQGRGEDHRGQQAGDGLFPTGSLDDEVGAPGGLDAAPAVHPHHHQARQRQQVHGPGGPVAHIGGHIQQAGKHAAADTDDKACHQAEEQTHTVDA